MSLVNFCFSFVFIKKYGATTRGIYRKCLNESLDEFLMKTYGGILGGVPNEIFEGLTKTIPVGNLEKYLKELLRNWNISWKPGIKIWGSFKKKYSTEFLKAPFEN